MLESDEDLNPFVVILPAVCSLASYSAFVVCSNLRLNDKDEKKYSSYKLFCNPNIQ